MNRFQEALDALKAEDRYREMRSVSTSQEAEITLDGRQVVNFSGNNSLGLASDPSLIDAACKGLKRFGLGSGASRLISGNMAPHVDLERGLAAFIECEETLLFSSGYQANTGVFPALVGRDDLILSDELNHASLIDGIRLCGAGREIYPHNDLNALEQKLKSIPASTTVWVVTESLFSMEGDRAPLAEMARLKSVHPFIFYVDEAHALGALGPKGRGLAAEAGCGREIDLLLGTLGKAFGVAGAFIATQSRLAKLLVNKARTFIYTTAPPPALACAALAALDAVKNGDSRRERLQGNTHYFRERLTALLGVAPAGCDHIVPVPVSGARRVMQASSALLESGIFCQGIRPPTVPPGRCRLRFSVSAQHTQAHLDRAIHALEQVLGSIGDFNES